MPPPRQQNPYVASVLGFTLAEVLITLGIIGVVAALIIQNFNTKYRNHALSTQFKYAYNILYNTTNELLYENDFTTWPGYGLNRSETGILEMYHKKIPNSIICNIKSESAVCKNIIKSFKDKNHTSYDWYNNILLINNTAISMTSYIKDCSFNGYQHGVNNMCLSFVVDTNSTKGPNKPGYDRFTFLLSQRSNNPSDIRFVPEGIDYSIPDECTDSECGNTACRCNVSTKALQDSNYFKKLK